MMKKFLLLILIYLLILSACLTGFNAWKDSQRAVVAIDWSTASEIDTVGFNIYRSEQSNQGFVRINAEIIPASREPLTGGEYSFVDPNVEPGKEYYYLLEDVAMDGQVSRNGPIEVTAQANFWSNLVQSAAFGVVAIIIFVNKDRMLSMPGKRRKNHSKGNLS